MRKTGRIKQIAMVLLEGNITDLSRKQVLFEQSICRCGNYAACICPPQRFWIPKSIIERSRRYDENAIDGYTLWQRGSVKIRVPAWFFKARARAANQLAGV